MQTPIVIHNESGIIRAGLSSGDTPSVVLKTDSVTGNSPLEHDIVTDWDGMVKVWERVFNELDVDPKQHPVLMTETALNPKKNRERTVQVLFETFGVSGCFLNLDAVLALYGCGPMTGTVVNICEDVLHTVPIYDGYAMPHAILRRPGVPTTLESLFSESENDGFQGVHDLTFTSIMNCDLDIRPVLYENVFIVGSRSKFPGIVERMTEKLTVLASAVRTIRVRHDDPDNAVWNGGDKVAPILEQYGMWISRAEYEQEGPRVVHRKCF